jgi:hypothetical protein
VNIAEDFSGSDGPIGTGEYVDLFGHNGWTGRLAIVDPNPAYPLMTFPHGGGVIVVQGGVAEPLCTLRFVDGQWTAEYDPANLGAAAQAFLDAVARAAAAAVPVEPVRVSPVREPDGGGPHFVFDRHDQPIPTRDAPAGDQS